MRKILDDIRVLDLTRVLAGPWATQNLADFGAEVIKVERPGHGDDTRKWGPPFLRDGEGRETADAAYYLACNRGKKSVTLDLASPEGREIARALARRKRCAGGELQGRRPGAPRARLRDALDATTRASSIARSPASARTGPTASGPATTSWSRAWAG